MKWTKGKVQQEIKLFFEKGEVLTPKNVRGKYSGLYYAAIKHYGSWKDAVGESGFDYDDFVTQPWTAEAVLEKITELHEKGENLSTNHTRKNRKTLHDAAYRHFGSWQDACKELGIQIQARIRWDKDKVIEEINRMHEDGESLHSRNMQKTWNALLKAGKRYYGSWEEAVSVAGFDYDEIKKKSRANAGKLVSEAAKKRYTDESFIDEQQRIIIHELQSLYKDQPMLTHAFLSQNKSGLLHRCQKYFDSLDDAMKAANIDYESIKQQNAYRKWSPQQTEKEIKRIIANEEPLNASYIIKEHRQIYRATVKHFDSWENALAQFGIDYQRVKDEVQERVKEKSTVYTKAYVISELKKMKEQGHILSRKHVTEYSSALIDACYNRFGSLQSAIEVAGFNYEEELNLAREEWLTRQQEVQLKWTKEKVVEEIQKLYQNDIPLSKSYVQANHQSLYDGANNRFGNWESAVRASGIDYDEIREDKHRASYAGHLFEKLVDQLLLDIGIHYEKYKHEQWNPDYVLPNGIWMDAKLSQWTVFASDTIDRYRQHSRLLTIIYMRGRRGKISDEMVDKKVRLISVYKFIKQLPTSRQKQYVDRIEKIESMLRENESWE